MRVIIFLAASLLLVVAGLAQTPASAVENFKKIQWLVGQWNRTNARAGRSGVEEWTKAGPEQLIGRGINLKGKDTLFIEKLRIIIRDNELYYVADIAENKEPVYFRITRVTDDEFVCENQAHDFPKVISYQKQGTTLKAVISGNGKSIEYLFERKG